MSKALAVKGEKLLYEYVYRPVRGIVVDYKIHNNTLILIIEKENRELIEGPFDIKTGRGRPAGSKNKPKPKPKVSCPTCGANTHIKVWQDVILCTNRKAHAFDQVIDEKELLK